MAVRHTCIWNCTSDISIQALVSGRILFYTAGSGNGLDGVGGKGRLAGDGYG